MSGIKDAYDLVAIGSGPAGESATELAAFFGYRCLIIEKDAPGGTVTTSGGVPTKTLREAALYFLGFRDRDIYGFNMASPPEIMLDAIKHRTWKVGEALQEFASDNIRKRGIDLIHGKARLGLSRTVIVQLDDGTEKVIHANVILIAAFDGIRRLLAELESSENASHFVEPSEQIKRNHSLERSL